MRTIKFRGFNKKRGIWLYGNYILNRGAHFIAPQEFADGKTWEDYEVIPETVGQFTGLQDRNGRDIYKGDIVEHPYIDPIFGDLVEMKDGKGVKSVVVFHEGAFCVRYGEDVFYYLDQFTRHKHIEVVGNIHDNPEQLEKGGE